MDHIATVKKTSEILHDFSFSMKKNFGQNFLVVPKVPEYIANNIGINKETLVIEIGPGLGTLTKRLLDNAGKVICIELDTRMIGILNDRFKFYDNYLKVEDGIITSVRSSLLIISDWPLKKCGRRLKMSGRNEKETGEYTCKKNVPML